MIKVVGKKGGGGKLCRSETIAIRLDSRLRYFTELSARKQRRTVSSYIEWALDNAIKDTKLSPDLTFDEEMGKLWHIDKFERLKLLQTYHPELLTYEEELKLNEVVKNEQNNPH